MGLPSYVINFDELAESLKTYFETGITVDLNGVTIDTTNLEILLESIKSRIQDIDYLDLINALNTLNATLLSVGGTLGIAGEQKIYGRTLEVPANLGPHVVEFTVPTTGAITSITYSQSSWRYEDSWDLEINTTKIFQSLYTKEYGETKHFEKFQPINAGDIIRFTLQNNSSTNKILWVDFAILEGATI